MKAILKSRPGDASVLLEGEVPIPVPGENDIVVKVAAVSINPIDTKIRSLDYQVKAYGRGRENDTSQVLGFDAAGTVESVGSKVTKFKKGDRVLHAGVLGYQGAYAQYAVMDARLVGHLPDNLSFNKAAALPLVSLTAWEALVERLGFELNPAAPPNATLLIINGAGGVGSLAIQIARKLLKIPNVIATASRPETVKWCAANGATDVINHRDELAPQLKERGLKVTHILINYSTEQYIDACVELIEPLGKICTLLRTPEPFKQMIPLVTKCLNISGEFMFCKGINMVDMESQGEILTAVAKARSEGILDTIVTKTYPQFGAVPLQEAHRLVESGTAIGKVVIGGVDKPWV
ncbi:hypothetical protein BZG36_01332 [Bifiguratus adelaidae]|uniref:Enoyl reductase (ER) domain-containing protein n=1 Tax=Bifiguratus adelaidae TaxID=1938954 RepID=A0A261Y549_9FUNG|nr:hypothetical protein BZG36_01332 [Bifiguratus adelaidae]